jgi:hypothetical protein
MRTGRGKHMNYVCSICGYIQVEESNYDKDRELSYEICFCCGVQYGVDDEERLKLQPL